MVVPGLALASAPVTNRPVLADRLTAFEFDVPSPTVSVVVVSGLRRAAASETNRPVRALLLTLCANWHSPTRADALQEAQPAGLSR